MVGDLFIVSLVVFPVVLFLGYILENLVIRRDLGPFNFIINVFSFVGVLFHELSHYALCLMTGVPAGRMIVRFRSGYTGEVAPGGAVELKKPHQATFLQSILISLGPVLIGTWIIYFSLIIALSSFFHPVYRIFAGFLAFAILLASTPSAHDFRMMRLGLDNDPRHSLYQLFLLTISILMSWGVVILLKISFPIEFFNYFIIIAWYVVLKYSFIGIRWGITKILKRFGKEQDRTGFKRFSRRKYTSSKFK
ncbi:MAG: hypothetical protein ACW98D_11275 [Promethearchaeota archaeon]|jgi:hypothetical protein